MSESLFLDQFLRERYGISDESLKLAKELECELEPVFRAIDERRDYNQLRVLSAFQKVRVSEGDFATSRGYGYNDAGRDKLEEIYAEVFGSEAALVRISVMSGTCAITTALMALLRPGDELLAISGRPYDTLASVIGFDEPLRDATKQTELGSGSLRDFSIAYREVALTESGKADLDAIRGAISERTRVVHIQRSRGYDQRPALSIDEIQEMIELVKSIREDVIVFVDNCYGEFVETREPCHVGADLVAGSLIKNPGGGLVPCGAYIAGRRDLVELCANRYSAPGLGAELGANLGYNRLMYQGFYLAPHVVAETLKGMVFAAAYLERRKFKTMPASSDWRSDIVQTIEFKKREEMIAFVEAIQAAAPVDAFARPIPSPMPGYDSEVIMAAGAFVQGASIELSADGPLREPYTVYMQGGLVYANIKLAILMADRAFLPEN
ncbi:MAG: methionine gamma-lyase family protein [Eubacteriales bacterium]|nr:methionine gamma-lyase family protein [Eubacteriales bacterium]